MSDILITEYGTIYPKEHFGTAFCADCLAGLADIAIDGCAWYHPYTDRCTHDLAEVTRRELPRNPWVTFGTATEPEGFCPDCDRAVYADQLKTKRFAGERLTKCIACWAKYINPGGSVGGRFVDNESLHHTLYCPTCGTGWNPKAAKMLRPRECFKCRNKMTPIQALFEVDREADKRDLADEYLGPKATLSLLRREPLTVEVPQEGRGLSLVEPSRDLCTDFEMVRNLIYPGKGYGRFDFTNNPRRKRRSR